MAAITSSNVTVLREWDVGSKSGKFLGKALWLDIVLSAQGGTAGDIPASALGFNEIYYVQSGATLTNGGTITGQPIGIPATSIYGGTSLFPIKYSDGTPENKTGTLRLVVVGRPL